MENPKSLQQEILESYEANRAYEARKADEYRKEYEARKAAAALQEAKLRALQDTIGNYGNFRYIDLEDFIDPDNQNWQDYKYYAPDPSTYLMGPPTQGRVSAGTPVGEFIQQIRDAENIDDVKKQLELWNSSDPLSSYDNGINYIRNFIPRFAMRVTTPSTDGSGSVQTTTGGTQGTQGVQAGTQTGNTAGATQGAQAGATTGNAVAGGGVQGSNNGSGGTQGMKTGGTGGTLASAGVPRGGTKTIGFDDPYDPNPGNISLAYTMRNAPEQEQRAALINEWNREHGRESVPYIPGTKIPAGSLNRSSSTYASPGISNGGMYATGEGIKDANGNVLTNPGGNADYQYALRDPSYGLVVRDRLTDAQKNYLQAVSNNMGYNYNF